MWFLLESFYQKLGEVPLKNRRRLWKKTLFSKKMYLMKTLLCIINCSSENRSRRVRVKSQNMVCSKFKNETKTFLLERHILFQNHSLETKNSILMTFLKKATEGPERSTLKSKKCLKLIHFFKTKFPSFCSAGGKVHFRQGCRTVFAIKLKNFRSNPNTVEEMKKKI